MIKIRLSATRPFYFISLEEDKIKVLGRILIQKYSRDTGESIVFWSSYGDYGDSVLTRQIADEALRKMVSILRKRKKKKRCWKGMNNCRPKRGGNEATSHHLLYDEHWSEGCKAPFSSTVEPVLFSSLNCTKSCTVLCLPHFSTSE